MFDFFNKHAPYWIEPQTGISFRKVPGGSFKIGNMFSDDIRPQHWNLISEACAAAFADGCRGVVVSHGTDTMHITASALGFAFAGKGETPPGPIAMVGSQRSSDRGSSDATENLLAAVHWAAYGPLPTGEAGDACVVIMHDTQSDGRMAVQTAVQAVKAAQANKQPDLARTILEEAKTYKAAMAP